ncbi:antiviral reverse transcriptase Drt3a [Vreelandella sp. V005]|uniref:antiviral reverse transcriptase Drt3a n=1 Tax=Vreelandella sp. V005 TaxID=3459608 RepID=UPI004043CD90
MVSQAITPTTLSQCIYKGDIFNFIDILDPEKKKELIDSAFSFSLSTDLSFSTVQIQRNGKSCYALKKFDQVLISRNLAKNVSKVLGKSKSRNQISRQLVQHLMEGTSYRIYRLDIKSFFESVEYSTIQSSLEQSKVSYQTRQLISSIINGLNQPNNKGIPRGLEFSPSIAELVLNDFDKEMKNHEDVFFYCRYVDDIIFITNGFENQKKFLRCIKSKLPKELSLNYNKQKVIFVDARTKLDKVVATFDYLGYNYTVKDTQAKANKNVFREVVISLSVSRVKKIKSRISRSLFCFSKDGNFDILKQRIDYLTSNRLMKDKKSKHMIATGIYYNNVNLTDNSESLIEIDVYLKQRILGYSCKRGAHFKQILSKSQKRELLKFSFLNGYRNNNYKKFSPNKLAEIKNAWRY